jgi:hypothetical protein
MPGDGCGNMPNTCILGKSVRVVNLQLSSEAGVGGGRPCWHIKMLMIDGSKNFSSIYQ